jgi:hypothetical protein
MARFCLEAHTWEGKKVIFEETNRAAHESKHPELADPSYIQGRVRDAIERPTFVYRDFEHPKKRIVCYLEEYRLNGTPRYTKVVLIKGSEPWKVATAFRIDYVKEQGRTEIIYGKQ